MKKTTTVESLLRRVVGSLPPEDSSTAPPLRLTLDGVTAVLTRGSGGGIELAFQDDDATPTRDDTASVMSTSLSTLIEMSRRTLSPLRAVSTGRLKLTGDVFKWMTVIRSIGLRAAEEAEEAERARRSGALAALQGCAALIVDEQVTTSSSSSSSSSRDKESSSKKHTAYRIEVTFGGDHRAGGGGGLRDGWSVWRRYSEFRDLRDALRRSERQRRRTNGATEEVEVRSNSFSSEEGEGEGGDHGNTAALSPSQAPFPSKLLLPASSASLRRRRSELQVWLGNLVKSKLVAANSSGGGGGVGGGDAALIAAFLGVSEGAVAGERHEGGTADAARAGEEARVTRILSGAVAYDTKGTEGKVSQ